MSATTIFLGKLLGLYLVAVAVAMLADRRRTLAALDAMAESEAWMLFSGLVATAAGLALVIGHQVWSGGALAIIVTLAGWAALAKGLALLFLPARRIAALYKDQLGFERLFFVWMGAVLALGFVVAALAFAA